MSAGPVTHENFEEVEAVFGVALRFWRSAKDFIHGARAIVARLDGAPAAICYAAAASAGRAEIDVLTEPAHRQRGAARFAVAHFIDRCLADGMAPLWDCFSNNVASVQLARASGFRPASPPYPFFTIPR